MKNENLLTLIEQGRIQGKDGSCEIMYGYVVYNNEYPDGFCFSYSGAEPNFGGIYSLIEGWVNMFEGDVKKITLRQFLDISKYGYDKSIQLTVSEQELYKNEKYNENE